MSDDRDTPRLWSEKELDRRYSRSFSCIMVVVLSWAIMLSVLFLTYAIRRVEDAVRSGDPGVLERSLWDGEMPE